MLRRSHPRTYGARTVRTIFNLAAMALLVAGCAVQLRTAPAPVEVCNLALISVPHVTSAQSGLALVDSTGHVTEVLWPFGYTARRGVSGVELVDEKGAVVAREGDFVEMGGGLGANDVWGACPGSVTVVPAQG
jgi:hypothetical protein